MNETLSEAHLRKILSRNAGGSYYVAIDSEETPDGFVAELHSSAVHGRDTTIDVVRTLRGEYCRSDGDLFREIAAVLQFPLYFGNNWAAVHDCLYDHRTEWTSNAALIIANASELLVEAPPGILRVFHEEMIELAGPPEQPRDGNQYWTVIYFDTREGVDAFRERLELAMQTNYHD